MATLVWVFIEDLVEIKGKAPLEYATTLWNEQERIINEVMKELKDLFEDHGKVKSAIMPLTVAIQGDKRVDTIIYDRRFNTRIEASGVSTSVIAPLLFDYVTSFCGIPGDKVLVIKEPEESITPLQQVVFAKYLVSIIDKNKELLRDRIYVVLTIHSSYILAFSEKTLIKFFNYDPVEKKIVVENKPYKSYALAEAILASDLVRGSVNGD